MADEYLAFIGITGALIGFSGSVLVFWLTNRSGKKDKDYHITAVRELIKLEICHNRDKIQKIWDWINEPDHSLDIVTKDDHIEYKKINLANRFMEFQLPSLSNEYWISQLHIVPIAFSIGEIKDIDRFYGNLMYIPTVHSSFVNDIPIEEYDDVIANWGQFEEGVFKLTKQMPKIKVNNNTKCPKDPYSIHNMKIQKNRQ